LIKAFKFRVVAPTLIEYVKASFNNYKFEHPMLFTLISGCWGLHWAATLIELLIGHGFHTCCGASLTM
jgi:hypothetical protein